MTFKINMGLLALVLVAGADASATGAQAAPRTIQVAIEGFKFSPARIDAQVGDTIEWTNKDFAPHTATEVGGKWTTLTLKKGDVGRIVVKAPGTYAYRCNFHAQMNATIVVAGPAPASSKTVR